MPVAIPGTLGAHMILPAVAAAAVGHAVGMDRERIAGALSRYDPPFMPWFLRRNEIWLTLER